MAFLVVGMALVGAAGVCLWLLRRRDSSGLRLAGLGGAGLVLVLGILLLGLYCWAHTATDTSQFARALVWGESAYGDQDRFPTRVVAASVELFVV